MRSIDRAARLLADSPPMRALPLPIPDLIALLMMFLQQLGICEPKPAAGFALVTWKPWKPLDLFGHRLARHRAWIESRMAIVFRGTPEQFDAIAESVWQRIDEGVLTADLMTGLYEESQVRIEG